MSIEKKIKQAKQDNLFPLFALNNKQNYPTETGNREHMEWWIHSPEELNPDYIKNVIKQYPKNKSLNINGFAILLGEVSGAMVIDVDDNHNDEVQGTETFKEVFGCSVDEVQCPQHVSPRGGRHLFFKYDDRFFKTEKNVFPGIDVLSNRQTTPTRGTTQRKGEYKAVPGHDDFSVFPEMPGFMLEKLLPKYQERVNESTGKQMVEFTSDIEEGGRNETLFSYANQLAKKGFDRNQMLYLLKSINTTYCFPPLPDREVETIVKSASGWYSNFDNCYTDDKVIILPYLIQCLMPFSYLNGNTVMNYDFEEGYYRPLVTDEEVESLWYDYIKNPLKDYDPSKAGRFRRAFRHQLVNGKRGKQGYMDEKNYICFKNGVLDLKDYTLKKHSPEYHLTAKVNYDYEPFDPEKLKGTRLEKYLECVDEETRLMLQETVGLVLSPHAEEHTKMIVLYGGGQNGKSVFFSLLEHMFYNLDEVRTRMSVKRFGERFAGHEALGKLVNLVADDYFSTKDEILSGDYRSMISGESIPIEEKGKGIVQIKFNMTHVIGVNTLPIPPESTHAYTRRILIIPFNKIYGSPEEVEEYPDMYTGGIKDSKLLSDIKGSEEEMKLFISWGVEGLKRLQRNAFEPTVSKASRKVMRQYKADTDSVRVFLNERVQVGDKHDFIVSTSRDTRDTLYTEYTHYCMDELLESVDGNAFTSRVKKFYEGNDRVQYKKCGKEPNRGSMGFYGLKLKNDDKKEVYNDSLLLFSGETENVS